MIYDPAETRLLQLAKERGAQIIPGIEMFVHQAARQFEIWTGKPAPRTTCCQVVTLALQDRAAARLPWREQEREQEKSESQDWPVPSVFSLVRDGQIIQVDIVRILPVIAVHLIVNGYPIPSVP